MKKILAICLYISFILFLPIYSLLNSVSQISFELFLKKATEPIALSAYITTISLAFYACILNTFFGFVIAWVLTRFNFPGKRILDACIDLPFVLPTSVAGLTLVTIYSDKGWIGSFFKELDIQLVFNELGVLIAMMFVSFPFVVRSIQPVLQEIEKDIEEVAWSLGASPWKTFKKIVFPTLIPATLTGSTLAFSRSIGEFGSIVIISSNFAFKDLITSVLIFQSLEQYDYIGATVVGTTTLTLSLILLLSINLFQAWTQKTIKN